MCYTVEYVCSGQYQNGKPVTNRYGTFATKHDAQNYIDRVVFSTPVRIVKIS